MRLFRKKAESGSRWTRLTPEQEAQARVIDDLLWLTLELVLRIPLPARSLLRLTRYPGYGEAPGAAKEKARLDP